MLSAHVRQIPWAPAPNFNGVRAFWLRVSSDGLAAMCWMRRVMCGLGGHAMVRHFEPGHMSLECMHCGERTPGWAVATRNI